MVREGKIWMVVLIIATIIGCEEVEEPALESSPPYVNVQFVADGSLASITEMRSEYDTIAKYLLDELNVLREINGDTTAILDSLQLIDIWSDSLSGLFIDLKSGFLEIDSFIAVSGTASELFKGEKKRTFQLPLNPQANESAFVFNFLNLSDTISFSYELRPLGGIERIILQAYDVKPVLNTFDSLSRHYCQDANCNSNEITYKLYF